MCAGSTGNAASVPDAGTGAAYAWTITNGTITSATSARTVVFTAGSTGSVALGVTVTAGSCPSTGSASVAVAAAPSATITAAASVCAGSTGNAASVPDAGTGATYAWTITNGTITSATNARTIVFTAGSTGPVALGVTVTAGGCTSTGSASVAVAALPATPVVATNLKAGAGSAGRVASVPAHAGSTYTWNITNGTITSGNGTASIVYTAGSPGPLVLTVTETAGSGGCTSAPGTATVQVGPAGTVLAFFVLAPCRVVDTRLVPGPLGAPSLAASQTRLFPVTGACGLPAAAKAVSANVTVTGPLAPGYLTLFAGDVAAPPLASTINFRPGQTRANNAIVPLALDGSGMKIFNGSAGNVDVIVDVNGWFQ